MRSEDILAKSNRFEFQETSKFNIFIKKWVVSSSSKVVLMNNFFLLYDETYNKTKTCFDSFRKLCDVSFPSLHLLAEPLVVTLRNLNWHNEVDLSLALN